MEPIDFILFLHKSPLWNGTYYPKLSVEINVPDSGSLGIYSVDCSARFANLGQSDKSNSEINWIIIDNQQLVMVKSDLSNALIGALTQNVILDRNKFLLMPLLSLFGNLNHFLNVCIGHMAVRQQK